MEQMCWESILKGDIGRHCNGFQMSGQETDANGAFEHIKKETE